MGEGLWLGALCRHDAAYAAWLSHGAPDGDDDWRPGTDIGRSRRSFRVEPVHLPAPLLAGQVGLAQAARPSASRS
jgi:hypothetical protein